jgi:hypothetical protein
VAIGGNSVVATNTTSAMLSMSFVGSTLNATGTPSRAVNVGQTSQLALALTDTILTGSIPIGLSGASTQLMVTPGGINLLHGSTTTILAFATGSYDISGYQTNYDANAKDMDPKLSTTDYVHLLSGSPAVDLTHSTTCSTMRDIDGEMRPKGTYCDVGADEQ